MIARPEPSIHTANTQQQDASTTLIAETMFLAGLTPPPDCFGGLELSRQAPSHNAG
jgi:hypothetical protein